MKDNLLIYVCDVQGQPAEWIRIVPLGRVELRDSRKPFDVTPADLKTIIEKFQADNIHLVVDYQHQSLGDGEAPAAGWIQDLEARADGLYSRVKWTAKALKQIQAGEFRYYSPVIKLTRPMALMHAALTNTPALKGAALSPLLAAKYGGEVEAEISILMENSQTATSAPQQQEEATAMLNQLIAKFGLNPKATEAEVLALVESREKEAVALKAQAAALPEIALGLGLKAEAPVAEIKGVILALKQGADQWPALQAEVAALKVANIQGKAEAAVNEALKAGKIQPFQRDWAVKYASEDPTGFAAFVLTAMKMVPMGDGFKAIKDGEQDTTLAPEDLGVCASLGITAEAFKVERQKELAAKNVA